ncbi:MAG: iron-containing alcohol dehydrogenase [Emcibacteraceae bacterium]|nr:iron-containing alcohol dehydrogenase [Emcibacteraceae bacterium]MDG1859679.1 iron-containing alcohol dehydrogenase [Emcibacteraceae bacterium]
MIYSANWNYPTAIALGAGRINEVAAECKALGIERPLIVTDPGLMALPFVGKISESCEAAGLGVGIFSGVNPNPTGEDVDAGLTVLKKGNHDGVIALGGGSSLDAGKAIALMAGQSRPLWDFEDVGDNWTRVDESGVVPIIAVPTTAGTGSEVGRASVILDTARQEKKIIFHPMMLPSKVILDPKLTVGLPAGLTAATGIDALSHSLEAFCAPGYHPMARGIAVEAIGLVKEWLPIAVSDGSNIDARTHMLVASTMGATAFQNGLGAMHAIAHSLGAVFGSHHGMLNAILMPYVLKANRSVIEDDIAWLAYTIGLDGSFEGFQNWVLELREELEIPHTLAGIDIKPDCIERIGAMSMIDPSASTNPILFNEKEYSAICLDAINGTL